MADHRPLLLAALLLLGGAAPASAGTLSVSTTTFPGNKFEGPRSFQLVKYVARPGERNQPRVVDRGPGQVVVSDPVGASAGPGCTSDGTTASCPVPDALGGPVSFELGDGDDVLLEPARVLVVDAGPGDDTVQTGGAAGRISGGAGADTLTAGPSTTTVTGEVLGVTVVGGLGPDVISAELVSYADATGPVRADLTDLATIGQPGEGDRVDARVRSVDGGPFADVLLGDGKANRLDGGPGDDQVDGRGGDDELIGGGSRDRIAGGAGNDELQAGDDEPTAARDRGDRLDGGPGNDSVTGGAGDGVLLGGPGADAVTGGIAPDRIDGGTGPDILQGGDGAPRITSRDGDLDLVACDAAGSRRRGTATVDVRDLVRDCRTVRRQGVPGPRVVSITQGSEVRQAVSVDVGCPQDVVRGCRIEIRVEIGGRVVRRRVERLASGAGEPIEVLVPAGRYRAGTASCGRLPVAAVVTSRDARGRAVRVRGTVRLRSAAKACGPLPVSPALATGDW